MKQSTRAERRALVERMLVEDQTRSDRSIARAAGVSHTHIAEVRRALESAGTLPPRPFQSKLATQPGGNLQRQTPDGEAIAETHGAYSERRVGPLRERYLGELRVEFPNASERRLVIQAHRLGQLELLGRFTDERGVIRSRRHGNVFPATTLGEKIATAYLAEHDRLEQREREHAGGGAGRRLTLAEIEAEPDEDEGVADGGEGS
ncbi:MAG: hypothetical protein WA484_16030 [Solirubrobacteraceae bacterium]